uniref:Uncharacterized protein n=1 Tax=Hyaloperonospora arabidopsidis (strain Emoy2) TaxID=559515 RepID=M4BRD5_HYAAE
MPCGNVRTSFEQTVRRKTLSRPTHEVLFQAHHHAVPEPTWKNRPSRPVRRDDGTTTRSESSSTGGSPTRELKEEAEGSHEHGR